MRYLRIVLLGVLASAVLAVFVLLLWSGGGEQNARANPELTVGIDLNPNTPAAYESCIAISGVGVSLDVDVFVLDVVDLMAFSVDVEYDSAVLDIVGVNTNLFLGAQAGSNVVDASGPIPPSPPGKYEAGAFDESNQGDDGSGVLARLTVLGIADGLSNFDLDLDPDPVIMLGVTLQDTASPPNPIGDTNGDTFFDGPFINASSTIAVGQDNDLDGFFDFACPGQPVDNCPEVYNPTQSDVDGDGLGDPCDDDADADGYWKDEENLYGSKDWDASSVPEACDDTDNDGDTLTDEGFDYSRPNSGISSNGAPNGIPDCTEDVHSDDDGTANPNDDDDDNDGTSDTDEGTILTDSLVGCDDGIGYPDWPPDFDENYTVNILDVGEVLPPTFGSTMGDPGYDSRHDLKPDGVINVLDVGEVLPPIFGSTCTP